MTIVTTFATYFLIPLLGLTAIVSPSIQGMISARVPAERQGEISGVLAALMGVAAIVSPPMMTGIFAAFTDAQGAFWPTAPFAAAAAVVLAALVVFLWGARGEAE